MAEVLRQALRSLCNRTGWCYSVFWKLKRRSRMVLTWEDHYYEFSNGRNHLEPYSAFKQEGCAAEDQIELAVAKMSFHVYSLGEGIIGRVAFTGKHQWVFSNNERAPASLDKYPDGWSNQFAAGIKTIAVVAVQQGVVQLGSTQMMTEDLNLVGQIRALFGTLQSVPGAFVSDFVPEGGRCFPSKTPSAPITSTLTGLGSFERTLRSIPGATVRIRDIEMEYASNSSSAWPPPTFPTMEQRPLQEMPSAMFQTEIGRGTIPRDGNLVQTDFNFEKRAKSPYEVHKLGQQSLCRTELSSETGKTLPALPCDVPGYNNNSNKQIEWSNVLPNSVLDFDGLPAFGEEVQEEAFDYGSLFKAFQRDDLDDFNNLLASLNKERSTSSNGSQFAIGDELSEVLLVPHKGPGKEEASITNMLIPPGEDMKKKQLESFELPSDIIFDNVPTYSDIFAGLSDNKPEQLLEAIVAGANSSTSISHPHPNQVKLSPSVAGVTVLGPNESNKQLSNRQIDTSVNWSRNNLQHPTHLWKEKDCNVSLDVSSSSWTEGSHTQVKKMTEKQQTLSGRKQEEPTRIVGRKRLRPGEAPRPRPKDRQQIQDRVRELRDIVPNATKCSIDALLEKTIRHMKFLQSVTQHGDKWKFSAETNGDGQNGLESGASWALEFDGKGTGVPILVENLKQPRQMLVEMLCEERGLFWEIAENIRSLGLTILKGVMESRNDKIWARFNVEMQAAKEVNRLKVLWNLTQLLKLNTKAGNGGAGYNGSEVTEVCSDSLATRYQHSQVAPSHGITVSPGGW